MELINKILASHPNLWPHQIHGPREVVRLINEGEKRICLTSPTGMGKSLQFQCLIEWAIEHELTFPQGRGVTLYTNRNMLREQVSNVLAKANIDHGVRAAGVKRNLNELVQVASIQTDNSRVYKIGCWDLHKSRLVLIDEAHLNNGAVAQKIVRDHIEAGAVMVCATATPIGLEGFCNKLVVAGTNSEGRRCGALVKATHIGCDEPDTRLIRQQPSGEFSECDKVKVMMTPTIFGRVISNWKRLNPEQKPTILFAPGVGESIWFAQQFKRAGIKAAHIDGMDCWIDGEMHKTSPELRRQIMDGVSCGDIKVVTNRFVLREGLDFPKVSHLILATIFGSLQSYLQSCGRGLRSYPGKDECILQDHGGHFWRHGSVNVDRLWDLADTDESIASKRLNALRDKKEKEPICCPQCQAIRASGNVCHVCGFITQKSVRRVIELDGEIKEHYGDVFSARKVKMEDDTSKKWERVYWRCRNGGKTFNQARGLFKHENGYWPPQDIAMMPTHELDWSRKVKDVPYERLVMRERDCQETVASDADVGDQVGYGKLFGDER